MKVWRAILNTHPFVRPEEVREMSARMLVTHDGKRVRRFSTTEAWFDNEQDAWCWLLDRSEERVASARRGLDLARSYQGNVLGEYRRRFPAG